MEWTLSESGLNMKWIKTDIITDNEAINLDWSEIDRIQSTAITSIGYGSELGESLIITTISGKKIQIRHLEKTKDDFFAFKNNLYSFNKKNNILLLIYNFYKKILTKSFLLITSHNYCSI